MKAILFTSDDFGMTLSINHGIVDAWQRGVVGATNLMVPCPWFSDAVQRARAGRIPVGIHLTITCEWERYRWRPLTESPRLRAADGGMPRAYADLPSDLGESEIRAEFDAQLRALRAAGVEPTHVDSHMISSESSAPMELRVKRVIGRLCEDEGLIYTYARGVDGKLEHFDSEMLFSPVSRERLFEYLSGLGEGVHHVITHCALASEEQSSLTNPDSPNHAWAEEYRIKDHATLTDPELRRFLEEHGFAIVDMHRFLQIDSERRKKRVAAPRDPSA